MRGLDSFAKATREAWLRPKSPRAAREAIALLNPHTESAEVMTSMLAIFALRSEDIELKAELHGEAILAHGSGISFGVASLGRGL